MRGGWSGASRWAVGRGLRGTAFELVDEVAQQGEHDVVFAVEELACGVHRWFNRSVLFVGATLHNRH